MEREEVDIRYLKQGLVRVKAPRGFHQWSAKKRLKWAQARLNRLSDKQLWIGLLDFDLIAGANPQFFLNAPAVAAIQTTEGDDLTTTDAWECFWKNEENWKYDGTAKEFGK